LHTADEEVRSRTAATSMTATSIGFATVNWSAYPRENSSRRTTAACRAREDCDFS